MYHQGRRRNIPPKLYNSQRLRENPLKLSGSGRDERARQYVSKFFRLDSEHISVSGKCLKKKIVKRRSTLSLVIMTNT